MSKLTRKRSADRIDLNSRAEKKHCESTPAHGRQEGVARCQNFRSCENRESDIVCQRLRIHIREVVTCKSIREEDAAGPWKSRDRRRRMSSRSGCRKECLTLTRTSMCAACAWSFLIGFVLWSLTRRVTAFASSENGFCVTEQANVPQVTLTESQKNTKNNAATIVHAVCI